MVIIIAGVNGMVRRGGRGLKESNFQLQHSCGMLRISFFGSCTEEIGNSRDERNVDEYRMNISSHKICLTIVTVLMALLSVLDFFFLSLVQFNAFFMFH